MNPAAPVTKIMVAKLLGCSVARFPKPGNSATQQPSNHCNVAAMSKHVLVTGGAGFIGSHLVDAYLERGWRVTVIDDLSTGDRRNLDPRAEFHQLDVRKALDIVRKVKPDVINHHAAQMDVRRSVADPLFDAGVNVMGSLSMLQAAIDTAVKRFIFASSGGAPFREPLFVPQ